MLNNTVSYAYNSDLGLELSSPKDISAYQLQAAALYLV